MVAAVCATTCDEPTYLSVEDGEVATAPFRGDTGGEYVVATCA